MSDGWAYIGRTPIPHRLHPAGTVLCATVDLPERAKDNAREIAKWIRDGLTIERVPVLWVRQHFLTTHPYIPEATS